MFRIAEFGTGRLVTVKVWKGGEIGSGLDLAEILVWLLDTRSHRSWVVVRGLGLSHRISFLTLELLYYYHTYR